MEYTTVHLLLSSLFSEDAQEPQLIFKTRASEKPRGMGKKLIRRDNQLSYAGRKGDTRREPEQYS